MSSDLSRLLYPNHLQTNNYSMSFTGIAVLPFRPAVRRFYMEQNHEASKKPSTQSGALCTESGLLRVRMPMTHIAHYSYLVENSKKISTFISEHRSFASSKSQSFRSLLGYEQDVSRSKTWRWKLWQLHSSFAVLGVPVPARMYRLMFWPCGL